MEVPLQSPEAPNLIPPRSGFRHKSKVLPHFNKGLPFQLVEVTADGKVSYGVLHSNDEHSAKIYMNKDLLPTSFPLHGIRAVHIPFPPQLAFEESCVTIGGIGKHLRWKVILARKTLETECSLFISKISNVVQFEEFVKTRLNPFAFCSSKYTNHQGGMTTTVTIPNHKDLAFVAAAFHCEGYSAVPWEDSMASYGALGIERYDRSEHMWWNQDHRNAGPIRDTHKWKYGFIPKDWNELPFTWYSLASNINVPDDRLDEIDLPLREHVKNYRSGAEVKEKKYVTSRLTNDQNRQLLQCTYWTFIAPFDEHIVNLASIIQFRYMLYGYLGREVGGYRQKALYIGHGAYCRKFKHKPQYKFENLNTNVRNKITNTNGVMLGSGFKGTRGKYRNSDFPEYCPKKRMKRSFEAEMDIREAPSNSFEKYKMQRAA